MTDVDVEVVGEDRKSLPILENWQAQIRNEPRFETQEFPMYTDARLISEVRSGCGPYSFLNALPRPELLGKVQTGFFLRCDFHWAYPFRSGSLKTDEANYHGGWLQDEASALASLVLGVRVRAGDHSRTFGALNDDPMGTPRANLNSPPTLSLRHGRLIVPSASGQRILSELTMLGLLLKLSPPQSVALLRAARLYQDALWIVESEPELAWLMLVSALETAALTWHQKELTSIEILKTAKSEFAKSLDAKGHEILAFVAGEVAPLFKSTAKYQRFCLHFLPAVPTTRPYEYQQVEWTNSNWKRILNKVYEYRSRALHSGIPFPRPMCEPPEMHGPDSVPSEKGTDALAVRTLGASWNANDLPVSLNTFTQLTQSILIAWWRDMAGDNRSKPSV